MADDQTVAEVAEAAPAEPSLAPATPSIPELLAMSDEDRAALPPEQIALTPEAIKEHVEHATQEAVQQAQSQWQARQAQAEAERKHTEQQQASTAGDIAWLEGIERRLTGADAEEAAAALAERGAATERYQRAVATKYRNSEQEVSKRVLAQHYAPQVEFIEKEQPGFVAWLTENVAEHGGSIVNAAIHYGLSRSTDEAFTRGKDEGAREERIRLGEAEGRPAIPADTGGTTGSPSIDQYVRASYEQREEWRKRGVNPTVPA